MALGREAAEVMLQAGRALPPRVRLAVLESTSCGWTLAQLIAEQPENKDMELVAAEPG